MFFLFFLALFLDVLGVSQLTSLFGVSHLNTHLNLPHLTPQSAILSFLDISDKDYLIVNYLLLLFKYYIYNARDLKHLVFKALMKNLKNIYNIEKHVAVQDPYKKTKFLKK